MKKIKYLLLAFIFGILISTTNVYAKNEVTLNFKGATIHDGYVEYSKKAKVQLFKGEDLVTNISDNMVIDLSGAEYKLLVEEIEDASIAGAKASIKLKINNWYYPMTTIVGETKSTFKLDSSKFNGTLDIEIERISIAVNTTIKNIYNDISSKGIIDLSDGKEYTIDFSKTDELTEGLKSFADLDKTLYYQVFNGSLLVTDDESIAVIKITGNKKENKAVLTAVNVENKKSEIFKGFHMQYTGSALDYDDIDDGILLETRYDYYTRCTYEFDFQYVKEVSSKEYKFTEGANQKYVVSKNKLLTFTINADYSLFGKVYIDDELVDSSNYTSKSGSTIITFNYDFIKSLSTGSHSLKVIFDDQKEVVTTFTLSSEIINPQTYDNGIILYTILGVISLIVVSLSIKKLLLNK